MNFHHLSKNKVWPALFCVFLFMISLGSLAQTENTPSSDSVIIEVISIDNISDEREKIGQRISNLNTILLPSNEVAEVDSLLDSAAVIILIQRDSLYSQINDLSRRQLKIREIEWTNYRTNLKSYQKVLKDRTEDVTKINAEVLEAIQKWDLTKQKLEENSESKDLYSSLDTVILKLNEVMQIAHTRLDSIFIIQKQLTDLVLIIDEALSEIDRVELRLQKEYFVFDSPALWEGKDTLLMDSSATDSVSAKTLLINSFTYNMEQLSSFYSLNVKATLFQCIFLIVFLTVLLTMRKSMAILPESSNSSIEIQTKTILANPISSVMVVGLLISIYFYPVRIPVISELHITLILIGTTILLPKLTFKKFSLFILLIILVYLLNTSSLYLESKTTLTRWIILISELILLGALILAKTTVRKSSEAFERIYPLFRFVLPTYSLVLVSAVIANVIGMVSLSHFLLTGVLTSLALGLVLFLSIKIITSVVYMFFKLRSSNKINAFSSIADGVNNRFQPSLVWIGIALWLMYTLMGFDVFDLLIAWFNNALETKWEFGQMSISLGGILSFFIIFIIALILSKIVASIFQDEWMIDVLPRGIAPAISLILRIVLIGIGLYMALSAAGVDLSKMGFIVGALGVGIGFGLQNVVLNFIAGLILAFERPINIGDAIEVDQEKGVVTNIGVRSSNIRMWSGAEAIIPNGDLISKKVVNWTLANRDRRSKVLMRSSPNADPEKVIALFNEIASSYDVVYKDPAPKTYFYGYGEDGNLSFALLYWTTFSDTLKTDSAIALDIYKALKEEGIEAPMPNQRNFG